MKKILFAGIAGLTTALGLFSFKVHRAKNHYVFVNIAGNSNPSRMDFVYHPNNNNYVCYADPSGACSGTWSQDTIPRTGDSPSSTSLWVGASTGDYAAQ
jgi:hypothetical protein